MPGTTTLGAEVTNVSGHCIWILVDDEELALPYSEFPWFKAATIQQIINVLRPSAEHLYWPDLDVDLSVESIRHPDRFPLAVEKGKSVSSMGLWFWDDRPSRNARDPRVRGAIEPRHGSDCLDLGEKEKIRTNLTA